MEKFSFRPYLIIIGLMIVTSFLLAFTVDVELIDQPGVRTDLPREIAGYTGSQRLFCHNKDCEWSGTMDQLDVPDICPDCGEPLYAMSWPEKEQLPDDTEFVKYEYTNDTDRTVYVSIVLSGRERSSIHRPQRCLPGQGHKALEEHDISVPVEDRRKPLNVRVIESVVPVPGETAAATPHYYAYWFAGRGRETASHYARMFWLAWDRVVHGVAHKWAYISVAGVREEDSRDYEEQLKPVIAELYPALTLTDKELERH
ncbi:exosortase-associated EpsI family protein [Kiritimatiella glycovorans]|uniref:EpsI family protein n=1 Tax=Kiritimatiella glycovorans TaxID=1307763 RepID=A0A0G3ELR2_9BACT|nr:exosortase-associated EpsI family protein [Kiritimatiella glycovorans]AKJ65104.1 EpsI family protein [Kiritimatiella glycovorans]